MNMVPWGGPLGRASAVTGISASVLWQPLIPYKSSVLPHRCWLPRCLVCGKNAGSRAAQYGTTPYEQDSLLELYDEADKEHGTENHSAF